MKARTPRSMEQSYAMRFALVTLFGLIISVIGSFVFTVLTLERSLKPLVANVARDATELIAYDIEFAVNIGIPPAKLVGLEDFFDEMLQEYPQIDRIELSLNEANRFVTRESLQKIAPNQFLFIQILLEKALTELDRIGKVPLSELEIQRKIQGGGFDIGQLNVSVSGSYLAAEMQRIFFDMLMVLVVAIVIAYEIIAAPLSNRLTQHFRQFSHVVQARRQSDFSLLAPPRPGPLKQALEHLRAAHQELEHHVSVDGKSGLGTQFQILPLASPGSAIDIRLPLFIFLTGEFMQRSFLPIFTQEKVADSPLLSPEMMTVLPLTTFMLAAALLTPVATTLGQRLGPRLLFLLGVIPAILGHLGCVFADTALEIAIYRGLAGISYAIVTIACQAYVSSVSTPETRTRDLAMYVAVMMTSALTGTSIGALVASNFGFETAFATAVGLSFTGGMLGLVLLKGVDRKPSSDKKENSTVHKTSWGTELPKMLRNGRLMMVFGFGAFGERMIVSGYVFLFIPLYLQSIGADTSDIGRLLMVYTTAMILGQPLMAQLAQRWSRNMALISLATVGGGCVLALSNVLPGIGGAVIVLGLLGLSHIATEVPIGPAVLEATRFGDSLEPSYALSFLKIAERAGGMIGPPVVGVLIANYGMEAIENILAGAVALSGLLLLSVSKLVREKAAHVS